MRSETSSPYQAATALIAVAVLGLLLLQAAEATFSAGRGLGLILAEESAGLSIDGITPGGPADVAGLQIGDRLLEIDGRRVADLGDYDRAARGFERGQPVSVRLRRGGAVLERQARPGLPFPWVDFGVNLPAALAHLALGLLAFAQRPRDLRARLLAVLAFAVAIELSLPIGMVGSPRLQSASDLVYLLLTGLQMGLELHLASVIPEPRAWLRRRPWLPRAYYALGFGLALPALAATLAEETALGTLPWSSDQGLFLLLGLGLPVWAAGVLLLLGSAAVCHPVPRGRHQAGLVFIGSLPWALLVIASTLLELAGGAQPDWMARAEPLALLCYPVATFIAIFRYHLFDLEVVVKRSLVYGTLTASLLMVFYAAVGVGGALLSLPAIGDRAVWAVAGGTLLMGLLFSPLRAAAQRLIDRQFFRERAALRQELGELASRLPSLGKLPAMGQELVTRLCESLSLGSATLLLADPDTRLLSPLATHGGLLDLGKLDDLVLVPPEDALFELLRDARRPVRARQARQGGSCLAAAVDRLDLGLLVPVLNRRELVAVILLGRKVSGEDYALEELELLSLLSHHVATVFENARLFESATRDSLTGLLRREAVLAELAGELRRAHRFGRPLTIGMADLDHFKQINDRYGHLAGDLMLKRVAQTMLGELRGSDIVGRYGGEEFLIVLPETEMEGALRGAEKLRSMVEALEVDLEGETAAVTLSIGLASLSDLPAEDGPPPVDALIRAADACLYRAKRAGRNRVEPPPLPALWRAVGLD